MTHAIRLHAHGGPEALRWDRVTVGEPGPHEIRIRQRAVGLNYIDIYQRDGLYKLPALPAILGMEGAGEVVAIGSGVTDVDIGDRVAYAGVLGGYAEERLLPADRAVTLPPFVSDIMAASLMLRGMTVRYLLREIYPVGPGTTLLFHAAAGGVGMLASQWARHLGATVIGTVSSPEKAEVARRSGCTHVIDYTKEDFVAHVREITRGAGCDVVYDSVGQATFPGSLDCLKPRGLWVSFGNASGPVSSFDIGLLAAKGSLFATRPTLMTYTARRGDLLANAGELFAALKSGILKVETTNRYALSEAATAHLDMEGRRTMGPSVLVP